MPRKGSGFRPDAFHEVAVAGDDESVVVYDVVPGVLKRAARWASAIAMPTAIPSPDREAP
jgi:hypothetical protein